MWRRGTAKMGREEEEVIWRKRGARIEGVMKGGKENSKPTGEKTWRDIWGWKVSRTEEERKEGKEGRVRKKDAFRTSKSSKSKQSNDSLIRWQPVWQTHALHIFLPLSLSCYSDSECIFPLMLIFMSSIICIFIELEWHHSSHVGFTHWTYCDCDTATG